MSDIIKVDSTDSIKAAAAAWRQELEEAKSLVCTADTIQEVKKTRSDLSKKFKAAEESRRAYKEAAMEEYNEKLKIYSTEVSDPYKEADAQLKASIDAVENEQKADCERRLREYFAELIAVEGLPWLPFDRSGVVVDLTTAKQKTPRKAMDKLREHVQRVRQDVNAIAKMENADEIMDEYRQSLSLSSAVSSVNSRHERMERIRQEEAARAAQMAAEAENVQLVEVAAPEVIAPPVRSGDVQDAVEQLQCTFTVTATREKLRKLKDFMIQEGIQYE